MENLKSQRYNNVKLKLKFERTKSNQIAAVKVTRVYVLKAFPFVYILLKRRQNKQDRKQPKYVKKSLNGSLIR